jgi:hypothetical protein
VKISRIISTRTKTSSALFPETLLLGALGKRVLDQLCKTLRLGGRRTIGSARWPIRTTVSRSLGEGKKEKEKRYWFCFFENILILSYNYPNIPFPAPGIFDYELSVYNCNANTTQVWNSPFPWQQGINLCRGCQHYLTGPNVYAPYPTISGFPQAALCRFTYVPPGSDWALSAPLGTIFVLPFTP